MIRLVGNPTVLKWLNKIMLLIYQNKHVQKAKTHILATYIRRLVFDNQNGDNLRTCNFGLVESVCPDDLSDTPLLWYQFKTNSPFYFKVNASCIFVVCINPQLDYYCRFE